MIRLKVLHIAYKNIGLFNDGLDIDFTAADKVVDSDSTTKLFRSVYTQNVISFVGANASGKTTALKLIKAAIKIVVKDEGLDKIDLSPGIIKNNTTLLVDFFNDDKFYRLESIIGVNDELTKQECFFIDETIYQKNKSEITSKKSISIFSKVFIKRSDIEKYLAKEKMNLLKPQDSIVSIVNKNSLGFFDTLFTTNFNIYLDHDKEVMPLINLFDNSIESITSDDDNEVVVKFKNDSRLHRTDSRFDAANILSSGTIKGSNLITDAMLIIRQGGYLIVDEIENHLHKKIVQTIIGLFNDSCINPKGATLLFSTHYSEILDCLDRKDNIYVMLRNTNHIISAVRYSSVVRRNDVKKSEVLISNYIDGTAPNYENVQLAKELICKSDKN